MARVRRGCELCDGVAALHCAADDAHICWSCDVKVHSANFLVARHTRSVLCDACGLPTTWRASGTNPTPLTGLCASCSQGGSQGGSLGESQGECTTHDDGTVLGSRRAASRLCSTLVVGRSVSGHESGCSTSNAERCDGKVVEGDTVHRASLCESAASEVSSEDVEGVSVDTGSVQASAVSGVSQLLKMKRLDCCSPGACPQNKHIMMRALADVSLSVAHRQCECAGASFWSSDGRRATHVHQGITFEPMDCNRSQPRSGNSNRDIVSFLRSSAKRQRVTGTAQRRPSLPRSQHVGALSTSRLMRMLAKWHWDLHLSSPRTIPLALRMFCKVSRVLYPAVLSSAGARVTLAACLRLAAGLDEAQILVPKASEVAACAGVSTRRLAMTEIHLLALLGWRRFRMWAALRT